MKVLWQVDKGKTHTFENQTQKQVNDFINMASENAVPSMRIRIIVRED